jgi:acyl carrier protein
MSFSREVHPRLARVLSASLGVDEDEITPEARLQEDLGAESIDFLDVVFRLEKEFGIHIPRGELFPESVFVNNAEFVHGGMITDEGVRDLRSRLPYAELGGLDHDRRPGAIRDLYTVDFVARYMAWKLGQPELHGGAASAATVARPETTDPQPEIATPR